MYHLQVVGQNRSLGIVMFRLRLSNPSPVSGRERCEDGGQKRVSMQQFGGMESAGIYQDGWNSEARDDICGYLCIQDKLDLQTLTRLISSTNGDVARWRQTVATLCSLCSAMTKWSCVNYCDVRFCSYCVMSLMGQSLFGLPIRTAAIRHATRIDIDLFFIGIHGENHATCSSTGLPQP